ncbi:hypothetical protein GCM10010533_47060 [Mycolicibacterium pallens]
MIGETLTVSRGSTDNRGNRTTTGTHTITGAFGWGRWSRTPGERAESSKGTAELYVSGGTDLQVRDRVTRSTGQIFAVVGGPFWDQAHPLTGYRFDWAVYELEAVTG